MSLKAVRQPTQLERIVELEKRDKKHEDQLTEIGKQVGEIYTLLIQAKGVVWLGTKIAGGITLICAVVGAIVTVVKLLHG